MLAQAERAATPDELQRLGAQAKEIAAQAVRNALRTFAAALMVCGVLAALTILASDAPLAVILGVWGSITLAIGGWSAVGDYRSCRRQASALRASLEYGLVSETYVEAAGLVEFEEFEDEGACWAFQVEPDRILFITGQQFYESEQFPCSPFRIVEPLMPNGLAVDEWLEYLGPRTHPQRVIQANVKIRLEIPEHLELIEGKLEDVENFLLPLQSSAKSRQKQA